jgi:hypothetical protein
MQHERVVFAAHGLLPAEWQSFAKDGPVRTFNPGLVRQQHEWLLAYRVVGADGRRRIGICRLDGSFRVIEDSQQPFSDHVRFRADGQYVEIATQWFADPRLYRLGGRLFVYWNSGWHEPRNWQFLQELDPVSLLPLGLARELVLRGERQKLEKNWTLFAAPDSAAASHYFAVYSISPHRVLRFSVDGGEDIFFEEIARTEWSQPDYPPCHGGLRGGAPPFLFQDEFWSVCHSVHDGPNGYRYLPAVYRFAAKWPFAPTGAPTAPLSFGAQLTEKRLYPRLNTAVGEVIYPCGAVHDGARWVISHGINDEQCALSFVTHADLHATVRPLSH